jgi:hypothetical protein
MPNCAPEEAAVVTLPASVSANATIIPGPTTASMRSAKRRQDDVVVTGAFGAVVRAAKPKASWDGRGQL